MDHENKIAKLFPFDLACLTRKLDLCHSVVARYCDNRETWVCANPKDLTRLNAPFNYITVTDGVCALSYTDANAFYYIDRITSPGRDRACTFWATICARLLTEKPIYFLRKRDPKVIKALRLTDYQISNDLNL